MSEKNTNIQFTDYFCGGIAKRKEILAEPADSSSCTCTCTGTQCDPCCDGEVQFQYGIGDGITSEQKNDPSTQMGRVLIDNPQGSGG
jgi:hypothetical protein